MNAISKLGSKVNKIADGISELDPIGGAIMKATNPMNLFGGDSLSKKGGTSSLPGAPPMPGGMSIDELLARMGGGDKKKQGFDVSSVANTSTSMGKGSSAGSAGSSSGEGAAPAGGAGAAGGIGDMLKGIMGLVGQLLPLVMSFF